MINQIYLPAYNIKVILTTNITTVIMLSTQVPQVPVTPARKRPDAQQPPAPKKVKRDKNTDDDGDDYKPFSQSPKQKWHRNRAIMRRHLLQCLRKAISEKNRSSYLWCGNDNKPFVGDAMSLLMFHRKSLSNYDATCVEILMKPSDDYTSVRFSIVRTTPSPTGHVESDVSFGDNHEQEFPLTHITYKFLGVYADVLCNVIMTN